MPIGLILHNRIKLLKVSGLKYNSLLLRVRGQVKSPQGIFSKISTSRRASESRNVETLCVLHIRSPVDVSVPPTSPTKSLTRLELTFAFPT